MIEQKQKGSSLIDVIVGTAIMVVIFVGIFGIFKLSIELVSSSKAKTGALALANEQMEFLRSLSYIDVGTIGGIPAGNIPQEETIILNQSTYTRRTFIQYLDDPKDGLGVADENAVTTDYKYAKVEIKWTIGNRDRKFSLVSNIVPKGIETLDGGGILTINAIDAFGVSLPDAQVTIKNNDTNPTIDLTTFTNSSGKVTLPGTPPASNYKISVTKNGYSTAKTYDADTNNTNPDPVHLTVVESETTSSSFAIDILSSKTVRTWRWWDVGSTTPFGNIQFSMHGDKTIGSDGVGAPIYKYSASHQTDSSGVLSINNLEWDNYTITIDDVTTGYDIAQSCLPQPRSLSPGVSTTTDIILVPNTIHSLLVAVTDDTGALLPDASVRLYRTGYDNTQITSSCGQVFWSGLSKGTIVGGDQYTIDVSLSGYVNTTVSDVGVDYVSGITISLITL
jgi:hypothetical protein